MRNSQYSHKDDNDDNDDEEEEEENPFEASIKMSWNNSEFTAHLKEEDRFPLGEDVYSLIFVAPIKGQTFWFAVYVILLKLSLFTCFAIDLRVRSQDNFTEKSLLTRITQFLLLPVAVAMQEDLMLVYNRLANIVYDKEITKSCPAATETKFTLSNLLRFIDGLYSLLINFVLLLITNQILALFLNFAALQFMQSIDDVGFMMARNGYLGNKMESRAVLVSNLSLPKRLGGWMNSLDTILFFATLITMSCIFIYIVLLEQSVLKPFTTT